MVSCFESERRGSGGDGKSGRAAGWIPRESPVEHELSSRRYGARRRRGLSLDSRVVGRGAGAASRHAVPAGGGPDVVADASILGEDGTKRGRSGGCQTRGGRRPVCGVRPAGDSGCCGAAEREADRRLRAGVARARGRADSREQSGLFRTGIPSEAGTVGGAGGLVAAEGRDHGPGGGPRVASGRRYRGRDVSAPDVAGRVSLRDGRKPAGRSALRARTAPERRVVRYDPRDAGARGGERARAHTGGDWRAVWDEPDRQSVANHAAAGGVLRVLRDGAVPLLL